MSQINYMRIRILDPDDENWLYYIEMNGRYYVAKKSDQGARKFGTLVYGHGEIEFIRGFWKDKNLRVGTELSKSKFITQSARIRFDALGFTKQPTQSQAIRAFGKSSHRFTVMERIQKDMGENLLLLDFRVVAKGTDYQARYKIVGKSNQRKRK